MKWKGTVSHCAKINIAARFSSEKPTQARSSQTGQNGHWSLGRRPGIAAVARSCRSGCIPSALRCRRGKAIPLGSGQLIALTTHRLYQFEPELRAEPPYADVDHVRAWVEF